MEDPLEAKLPELLIEWTEKNGNMVSHINLDLGILGKFSLGGLLTIPKETFQEEKESSEHEAHVAFMRLLCRFAALAVVELDMKPDVLVGWYSHIKEKKTGDDTQYYVLPEE